MMRRLIAIAAVLLAPVAAGAGSQQEHDGGCGRCWATKGG